MRITIFAACLLWAVTASAQMATGNHLLQGLNLRNAYGEGFSQGYMSGVVDTARVFLSTSGKWACLPAGVKYPQIWAVVEKYVRDHPGRWHDSALELVLDASKEAWPCKDN